MTEPTVSPTFADYEPKPFFCELTGSRGGDTAALARIRNRFAGLDIATLMQRAREAENELFNLGITFTVYSEAEGSIDRAWPFDIIPRTISLKEWRGIERGLVQRVKALNHFIDDVYHGKSRTTLATKSLLRASSLS